MVFEGICDSQANHEMNPSIPWKVSLHGGHSGDFCDHATGSLREILSAAVQVGYSTFGVSEHVPRVEQRFLYDNERALGWDVEKLKSDFERYTQMLPALQAEFEDRIEVLFGFEAEVIPSQTYPPLMNAHRQNHPFDYMVGSVHYVREVSIDGSLHTYEQAIETCGGLENLAIEYYETVADMAQALKPEVVGHLDVIRKNAAPYGSVETPAILRAAERALEAIRACGAILDLNLAGIRKGLGTPYPAPWLLNKAHAMGVPFCFGDDSHSPSEVGDLLEEGRAYLLKHGITTITALTKRGGALEKRVIGL